MYLIGPAHLHKTDSQRIVERLISERQRLVTDAEVFQEVLHRYSSIRRHHDIQLAFDALSNIVDDVLPVDRESIERAKQIVLSYRGLSARDAVHLAVMVQHGITQIVSFDSGFDVFPGITRLS
jgi:hypothetical protein